MKKDSGMDELMEGEEVLWIGRPRPPLDSIPNKPLVRRRGRVFLPRMW